MSFINLKSALFFILFIGTESMRSDRNIGRNVSPTFLSPIHATEVGWASFNPFVGPFYRDEIDFYGPERKNNLLKFNYQDQTEWIKDEEIVNKKEECASDVETDPTSAVECFVKLNYPSVSKSQAEDGPEIFSLQINEEFQEELHREYCGKNEPKNPDLTQALEEYVQKQILDRYALKEGEELKLDDVSPGDLLKMDSTTGVNENMNHFYGPRGKPIVNPTPNSELRENAGPQPFHQDRSSRLAKSADAKNFLMLYTACSENLDTARTGTWVSSAGNDFFTTEYKCKAEAGTSIEECWQGRRDFGITTYESAKFRAPRYTMGDDWTQLNYIAPEAEKHIRNLKRFQQIPSVAGNVLVIMEKNVLHAGPETLPKDRASLNSMKRVVIRRRLSIQRPQVQQADPEKVAECQAISLASEEDCKASLIRANGDLNTAMNYLLGGM